MVFMRLIEALCCMFMARGTNDSQLSLITSSGNWTKLMQMPCLVGLYVDLLVAIPQYQADLLMSLC